MMPSTPKVSRSLLDSERFPWQRLRPMDPELRKDIRWQLIERIAASNSFQKSTGLRTCCVIWLK